MENPMKDCLKLAANHVPPTVGSKSNKKNLTRIARAERHFSFDVKRKQQSRQIKWLKSVEIFIFPCYKENGMHGVVRVQQKLDTKLKFSWTLRKEDCKGQCGTDLIMPLLP